MYYRNCNILSFYMMDMDNLDDAQDMLQDRKYYMAPDAPHFHMSASQVRDTMNIVSRVTERCGGYPDRITWWVELEEFQGQLVEVTDYEELSD